MERRSEWGRKLQETAVVGVLVLAGLAVVTGFVFREEIGARVKQSLLQFGPTSGQKINANYFLCRAANSCQ